MSAPNTAPTAAGGSSHAAEEQRVRELLARGKWRKARDELKPLVKANRETFLPLLIEANVGLAREMLAKGQTSEARQVLAYLETIAPAEQLCALKLDATSGPGRELDASSTQAIVTALTDSKAVIPDAERFRMVDALVLTFQRPPATGEAGDRLAAEVVAVQDALRAVPEGAWDRVAEALRAVPNRSPLRHWVIFIKGLAAFFAGDSARAATCFQKVDGPSTPARAAAAFVLLLPPGAAGDAASATTPDATTLERVGLLVGMPGVGSLLPRAESAWSDGRPFDSYLVLRTGLPSFPSSGADVPGALSDFYFKAPLDLPKNARRACLRRFQEQLDRRSCKPGAERMLTLRMLAMAEGRAAGTKPLRARWESYVSERAALRGPDPRFASLADTWLGQQLAPKSNRASKCPCPECRAEYGDPESAVAVLGRAINLDPKNREAHLSLATVFRTLKKTAESNRLADLMAARFPTDKEVLLAAARGCIERKAYIKGLSYVAQARLIDPLDPSLPELETSAQRRVARQYFQQRKPDKARKVLTHVERLLNDRSDDLQQSRWTARLRHGLMEKLWGDPAQGDALLAEARAAAPRADVFLLFAHLSHRAYTSSARCQSPFHAEWRKEFGRTTTVGAIATMLRVIDYWRTSPDLPNVRDEIRSVIQAIQNAARRPFTRTEVIEVIEQIRGAEEVAQPLRECLPLISAILREDPADPRFRLYQYEVNDRTVSLKDRQADYQAILDEAARRQDDVAVRRAREQIRGLDRAAHSPWSDDADLDDMDEDEDDVFVDGEFDDEDEDDGAGSAGAFPLPIPGAGEPGFSDMAALLDLLRTAPKSVIEDMRRTRPKDMPAEIFDILVRTAKAGRSSLPADRSRRQPPKSAAPPKPPAQPSPPPARAPEKPRVDPNQMNLL